MFIVNTITKEVSGFFFISAFELMFNNPAVCFSLNLFPKIQKNSSYLLNEGLRALQLIAVINSVHEIILCK